MRRFFPYFKYLRKVRGALIAGILCGILYGSVGGLGMPLMIKYVIPRVLSADPTPEPTTATDGKSWANGLSISSLDGFFDRMFGISKPKDAPAPVAPPPPVSTTPRPRLTTWQLWAIALWLP